MHGRARPTCTALYRLSISIFVTEISVPPSTHCSIAPGGHQEGGASQPAPPPRSGGTRRSSGDGQGGAAGPRPLWGPCYLLSCLSPPLARIRGPPRAKKKNGQVCESSPGEEWPGCRSSVPACGMPVFFGQVVLAGPRGDSSALRNPPRRVSNFGLPAFARRYSRRDYRLTSIFQAIHSETHTHTTITKTKPKTQR